VKDLAVVLHLDPGRLDDPVGEGHRHVLVRHHGAGLEVHEGGAELDVLAGIGPDPHVLAQLHLLLLGVEEPGRRLQAGGAALVVGDDAGLELLELDEVRPAHVLEGGARGDLVGPAVVPEPGELGHFHRHLGARDRDRPDRQALDLAERIEQGEEPDAERADHGANRNGDLVEAHPARMAPRPREGARPRGRHPTRPCRHAAALTVHSP
jgi:hypothetical protein